jgi:hypothetical protein
MGGGGGGGSAGPGGAGTLGYGGGVGLFGVGSNGIGGSPSGDPMGINQSNSGTAGSGGAAQLYGGGGPSQQGVTGTTYHPGTGAVRIMWGGGRSFPSNAGYLVGGPVYDPRLSINTSTREMVDSDNIGPNSTGFIVNQNSVTNINVTGGTYLFLAIA